MTNDTQARHELGIFSVRPATADDAEIIKMIVRAAMINPFGLDWRRFVVMEHHDWTVAIGQLKPHRDGSLELASIAVVSEWQGGGAGSALVHYLASQTSQPLYLSCLTNLMPFYERFGFQHIGVSAMPPNLRRKYRAINIAMRVARRPERLVIMKRES